MSSLKCLAHQYVNDRLLETGRDIVDEILWETSRRAKMGFHIIDKGSFKPAETEVQRVPRQNRPWKSDCFRISPFGELIHDGSPWITQTQELCGFIKSLSSSIISRLSQSPALPKSIHPV